MGTLRAACFDSNILIESLSGKEQALRVLLEYELRFASIVAWIEVLAGVRNSEHRAQCDALFRDVRVVALDSEIGELAATIRRENRLKLPDAIILATARHLNCQLVTRNTKDFDRDDPEILVPYTL